MTRLKVIAAFLKLMDAPLGFLLSDEGCASRKIEIRFAGSVPPTGSQKRG
jgi:hypothetical protein